MRLEREERERRWRGDGERANRINGEIRTRSVLERGDAGAKSTDRQLLRGEIVAPQCWEERVERMPGRGIQGQREVEKGLGDNGEGSSRMAGVSSGSTERERQEDKGEDEGKENPIDENEMEGSSRMEGKGKARERDDGIDV